MTQHLLTMGGGGFMMADDRAATPLDRFAMSLTGKQNPLVCYAPTATRDDEVRCAEFERAFAGLGARTCLLTLWEDAGEAVRRLDEVDLLYVAGGSTVNLVALWRAHGVVDRLRSISAQRDIVLAGLSAGANCWFEACTTDSFTRGEAEPWGGGLGFVEGSFCPHLDGEPLRRPRFTEAVAAGELPPGLAADDGAAVHFIDGRPVAYLRERAGAGVWRTGPDGTMAPLPMTDLPLSEELSAIPLGEQ